MSIISDETGTDIPNGNEQGSNLEFSDPLVIHEDSDDNSSSQQEPDPPKALPEESDQTPNVRLSGKDPEKALPPGLLVIGRSPVMIPDEQGQLDGFYTEHAGYLVHQFPQFKFIQKKGEPQGQTVAT